MSNEAKMYFHGTITEFEDIDLNKCKGYKDFGKGLCFRPVEAVAKLYDYEINKDWKSYEELLDSMYT